MYTEEARVTKSNIEMLRRPDVEKRSGKSRSTIYADGQDGLWPPPVRIGGRAVAWPANEVDAVLAARIEGRSDGEIRELVRRLVAARRAAT